MKKLLILTVAFTLVACLDNGNSQPPSANTIEKMENQKTREAAAKLSNGIPTPTDLDASLERYNLVRRAYWVNGQRQKALTYPAPIRDIPIGYVILVTNSGSILGKFVVSGKVSSLNSYLSPDSEYYEMDGGQSFRVNKWLADVDGSYGTNDNGIFFFTPDGKYLEWNGQYLYSDIPFEVNSPLLSVAVGGK